MSNAGGYTGGFLQKSGPGEPPALDLRRENYFCLEKCGV